MYKFTFYNFWMLIPILEFNYHLRSYLYSKIIQIPEIVFEYLVYTYLPINIYTLVRGY